MKRIISFVFLGLLVYAGIYVMIYGMAEYSAALDVPSSLDMPLEHSFMIRDRVSEQFGSIIKQKNQPKLFGVPIGAETTTYFYVISIGDHPDYLLLAVTDPEDIEAIENASPGNEFEFTGIVREMDHGTEQFMIDFLTAHPDLIGLETSFYIVQTVVTSHIARYVIYVRDIGEPDITPIIAGAAMILVGGGLAALLIIRIVRERTGY